MDSLDLKSDLMVAIQMITYNHENYIAKAIESVMSQKTKFNFKLIIAEDFSNDNTRSICLDFKKKYPEQIQLILNDTNIGVVRNAKQLHQACALTDARYIAILEGDDYWVDSYKLQKQVDFLENNGNYMVCGTDAHVLVSENGIIERDSILSSFERSDFSFEDLAIQNRLVTTSVLFRNHAEYKRLPAWFESAPVGDWALFLILSQYGRVKNLDFVGAVYRKHQGGVYSQLSRYSKNIISIKMYEIIIKEFKITDERVFKICKEYIFYAFNSAPSKIAQREMLLKYIRPLKSLNFSNRLFIKMLFRYFFVSTKRTQG
jgi:glycosyltransferase involved in cell wall biosynthesis